MTPCSMLQQLNNNNNSNISNKNISNNNNINNINNINNNNNNSNTTTYTTDRKNNHRMENTILSADQFTLRQNLCVVLPHERLFAQSYWYDNNAFFVPATGTASASATTFLPQSAVPAAVNQEVWIHQQQQLQDQRTTHPEKKNKVKPSVYSQQHLYQTHYPLDPRSRITEYEPQHLQGKQLPYEVPMMLQQQQQTEDDKELAGDDKQQQTDRKRKFPHGLQVLVEAAETVLLQPPQAAATKTIKPSEPGRTPPANSYSSSTSASPKNSAKQSSPSKIQDQEEEEEEKGKEDKKEKDKFDPFPKNSGHVSPHRQATWESYFYKLKRFQQQQQQKSAAAPRGVVANHLHHKIPDTFEGVRLASWVFNQRAALAQQLRRSFCRGELTAHEGCGGDGNSSEFYWAKKATTDRRVAMFLSIDFKLPQLSDCAAITKRPVKKKRTAQVKESIYKSIKK